MNTFLRRVCVVVAGCLLPVTGWSQDWTRFRGPNGTGISEARGVPVTWSEGDFRWRLPLPGGGHSQPVIWGDRLFVTVARETGNERALVCLNKHDGKELWSRSYRLPTKRLANRNTSYANASPVVDARQVVALFVSEEHFWVRAYDHDGKEQWSRDLGTFESQHGHGASPILHEGRVIVTNDQDGESSVVSLDAATGEVHWRSTRRTKVSGTAYGTPCVHPLAGGGVELLFTSQSHGVSSLDPASGALNWEAPAYDKRMCASPVVAGDLVIGSCGQGGGAGNYLAAIRLGGRGNVAKTHVAYTLRSATPYVPTPLFRDGILYWVSDGGVAVAVEAADGKEIWSERLRAEFFSSPIMVEGRIYCPSTKGEMLVWSTGRRFELLARNPIGEGTHSTPCVDGGRIYVRTFNHLVCVGSR
ncbi:MAG: PQQ-binding-like beta-propeller repeat protein [Verrucomicrobia bacterium]|nr:PQQ-binding-like beta-propeller repeat protein [Verrucomicrobiota bacterium]